MVNVLLLGADSQIGKAVCKYLLDNTINHVTILSPDPIKAGYDSNRQTLIKGQILNENDLDMALSGQDVVVVTLSKDVDKNIKAIIKGMNKNDVKRIIFVGYMGLYDKKPSVQEAAKNATYKTLQPFADAHKALKNSDLDFTIIRSNWVTEGPVNYEVNIGGMPFIEQDVSLDQIADLVNRLIQQNHLYERQCVGINTPL